MIVQSLAKINIGLQVLKKREDGYHDISSLMYLIPFSDIIEIKTDTGNAGFSFSQTGIPIPGDLQSNLCYKAWRLFSDEFGEIPLRVHLHKVIPIGAGLGGGSSNGAAILKGLNFLCDSPCDDNKLHELASQLGSDCSLFIREKASIAKGRGEILSNSPVDLSGMYLVLLNPAIEVNTASAYQQLTPDYTRPPLEDLLANPQERWKELILNDFEESVFLMHPEIAQLKSILYTSGAIYASMSGSGATVFGLFYQKPTFSKSIEKYLIFSGLL